MKKFCCRLASIAVFVVIYGLTVSGCAVIWSGHEFDQDKIFLLEAGKTTDSGVIALFGPPDNILRKPLEGTTAFIYKNLKNSFIGIPIVPGVPIVTLGKAKNTGYQLTILFSEGADKQQVVSSYELLEMQERIFE
jgi:hypothetical protein